MKNTYLVLICFFVLSFGLLSAQNSNDAPLSKNAPTDQPVNFKDSVQIANFTKLIKPYTEKALKTLPGAKKKFLKGLPSGEAFFLTTRIYDNKNHFEQIFVRVINWNDELVQGSIANEISLVEGYEFGQIIKFPESDIIDWLITKPNGGEEGNFVGKYLDSLQK